MSPLSSSGEDHPDLAGRERIRWPDGDQPGKGRGSNRTQGKCALDSAAPVKPEHAAGAWMLRPGSAGSNTAADHLLLVLRLVQPVKRADGSVPVHGWRGAVPVRRPARGG